MALIDINRNYEQGAALVEADLDAIQESLTTFFNTTQINDDVILDNSIDGASKLIDNTITTAKLQDASISGSKIADLAVTTAKIADANVTTDKFYPTHITTGKLANLAVTTAKIADGSVTIAKKKVPAVSISTGSGVYTRDTSGASSGDEDVTNLSASITVTQGRVACFLQPDGDTGGYLQNTVTHNTATVNVIDAPKDMQLRLYRDVTLVYTWTHYMRLGTLDASQNYGVQLPLGSFHFIDTPSNGTYTYTVKSNYQHAIGPTGNITDSSFAVGFAKLVLVEL